MMYFTFGQQNVGKLIVFIFFIALFTQLQGQTGPQPGDIYKEYSVSLKNGNDWRVTDPDAGHEGAQEFLPNPVLKINIDDLEGAIKAEALMDIWGGHTGTTGKQVRFNENEWIDIPDHPTVTSSPECYNSEYNYIAELPLEYLVTGDNYFQGNSGGQTCYNFNWGQWGWYVMIVRIYYDKDKPHPTGQIVSPVSGETIGENAEIKVEASSDSGIEKVEILGKYKGYDENGDGFYYDWHRNYHTTTISNHIGTISSDESSIKWNNVMIPDQDDGAVEIMARIKDKKGVWYVPEIVNNITFKHPEGISVKMFEPDEVPKHFWVRNNQKASCQIRVDETDNATDAYLHHRTWNGQDGGAGSGTISYPLSLNEDWSGKVKGKDHDFAYSIVQVPISKINKSTNNVYYESDTEHHGIEILLPGPALIVRYNNNGEQVAKPVISPEPGEYKTPFKVTMTCETPGAEIHYTTKGTEPLITSRLYTGPVSINEDATIRAKAFKFGYLESELAESPYTKYLFPTLIGAKRGELNNTLELMFNKPVEKTTAETSSNYSIDTDGTVISAKLDPNIPKKVIVGVTGLKESGEYSVIANNVTDLEGTAIEDNSTIPFVYGYSIVVTASFSDGENIPEHTLDGDLDTKWSAEGKTGVWIKYDLQTQMILQSIEIAFNNGDIRAFIFAIETSPDDSIWTQVFKGQSSGTSLELEEFDLGNDTARYVKILGYGNNMPSAWNTYQEVVLNTEGLSSSSSIKKLPPQGILVYPNPSRNTIYVDIRKSTFKPFAIQIIDITGKIILEKNISEKKSLIQVDVSTILQGTYIYALKNQDNAIYGMFLKQ